MVKDVLDILTFVTTLGLLVVTWRYSETTKEMSREAKRSATAAEKAANQSATATAAAERAADAARDAAAATAAQVHVEFEQRFEQIWPEGDDDRRSLIVIRGAGDPVYVHSLTVRRGYRELPTPEIVDLELEPYEAELPLRVHRDENLAFTHWRINEDSSEIWLGFTVSIEYSYQPETKRYRLERTFNA